MNIPIGDKQFQVIPRRVANFLNNQPRDVEKLVGRKKEKLECWQLTCQFPMGQSPAWRSSNRRNYESRIIMIIIIIINDNVYGAVIVTMVTMVTIVTMVTARVHPVHLMNAD